MLMKKITRGALLGRFSEPDDGEEAGGVKACAAHKGPVDVWLGHDPGHRIGLDGASVLDPDLRGCLSEALGELGPDEGVGLLGHA